MAGSPERSALAQRSTASVLTGEGAAAGGTGATPSAVRYKNWKIYFTMEGTQVCGRVNPNAGARDGGPLRLAVDLNNMHLLNEVTGVVL